MKKILKDNKGFTLLELIVAMAIMSIILATLMTAFMIINESYFMNSDKNEFLYKKQRVINSIKKDIPYKTQVSILDAGATLQITQPNTNMITYAFVSSDKKIYRRKQATGTITVIDSNLVNGDNVTIETVNDGARVFTKAADNTGDNFVTAEDLADDINQLIDTNAVNNGGIITVSAATIGAEGNSITMEKTEDPTNPDDITVSSENLVGGATEEMCNNLYNVMFELKEDAASHNQYVEMKGTLKGKSNNTNIDFGYVYEILNQKWDYSYSY